MSTGTIEQLDTPLEIYNNPANEYIQSFVVGHLNQKYESLSKCIGRL